MWFSRSSRPRPLTFPRRPRRRIKRHECADPLSSALWHCRSKATETYLITAGYRLSRFMCDYEFLIDTTRCPTRSYCASYKRCKRMCYDGYVDWHNAVAFIHVATGRSSEMCSDARRADAAYISFYYRCCGLVPCLMMMSCPVHSVSAHDDAMHAGRVSRPHAHHLLI
jgi:hypothetical protein